MVMSMIPWVASGVGLGTFLATMVIMNRGRASFVNLTAQDEPALVALGVFIIIGVGGTIGGAVGAVIVLLGITSRYTDIMDVENIIP